MTQADPRERVFDFAHLDYQMEFRAIATDLKIRDIVPYQTRHSSASVDRQPGLRTFVEVTHLGD